MVILCPYSVLGQPTSLPLWLVRTHVNQAADSPVSLVCVPSWELFLPGLLCVAA